MSPAGDRAPTSELETTFEVDRFEMTSDGRLEVAGRWYGLRGRRFLRPTLEVEGNGRGRRALALLEHKPWTAADGQEWVAAFDWDGDPGDLGAAELAVGADLTVAVSPTGKAARRRPSRPSAEARELASVRVQLERLEDKLERVRSSHAAELEAAGERTKAEQAANRKLLAELDGARMRAEESSGGVERLDGELQRLHGELARLRVDLEKLRVERDGAIADSGRLERERETAVRAGAAAVAQLEGAAKASQRVEAERDDARTRLRTAVAERDEARSEPRSAPPAPEPARPRPPLTAAPLAPDLPAAVPEPKPLATRLVAVAAVAVPLLILALLIILAF